jgi:predicted O-methyltransferase YrrM
MTEDSTGRLRAVVGHTREAAARAFGLILDDAVVTSYDDLGTDVDLTTLDLLALADGQEAAAVLEQVLASGAIPERLLVEVPDAPVERSAILDVLSAHPEAGIAGSVPLASGTAVLIRPAGDGVVTGAATAVVLEAAGSAARTAASLWPDAGPPPQTDGTDPAPIRPPRRTAPEAPPAPRGLLAKLGRRARVALAVATVAVVVAIVALVLIGRSDLGADGLLVALLVGVALLQGVTTLGLAYLIRGARGVEAEFRHRVLTRTERIIDQNIANRKRLDRQGRRSIQLGQQADRQQTHHEYVVELGRQLNLQLTRAQTAAARRHLMTQRQTQALLNLRDLVQVTAAVPPTGGWAASPDLLVYCVDALVRRAPSTVVECGSGISTLYLALAAEQHGLSAKIVALEHQERFAEATRALLEQHGVAHRAEVRVAPLEPTSIRSHTTHWYAESALDGLADIGLLLVDGPPTATGPQARYPAVPLLADRLSSSCLIVMDDLICDADHQTADSWASHLPDFELSIITEFDKHVGILRRD